MHVLDRRGYRSVGEVDHEGIAHRHIADRADDASIRLLQHAVPTLQHPARIGGPKRGAKSCQPFALTAEMHIDSALERVTTFNQPVGSLGQSRIHGLIKS